MLSKLAVLALVLSTSACAMTPQAKRAAYVGSAVTIAAGLVTSLVVAPNTCKDDPNLGLADGLGCISEASMIYAAGATLATVGLVGLIATASASTTTPAPTPIARELEIPVATTRAWATDDPALQQLSTKASLAAKVGQCTYVEQIAAQVSAIDPNYRSTGFLADPAISDCL